MISKRRVSTLAIMLTILAISIVFLAYSLPPSSWLDEKRGSYTDQHWYRIIEAADPYASALFTHEFDIGGLRAVDIGPAMDHGFTITSMKRIGQLFAFTNNRVWPFGIPYIYLDPDDMQSGYKDPAWLPYEINATLMRKALYRCINMDEIIGDIYTDPLTGVATHSKAERWLPPGMETWTALGQEPWIPDIELPGWDPEGAADLLDEGGWVQGTTINPFYDATYPGSAQYIRLDPSTGSDMEPFEYYSDNPTDAPNAWAMAERFTLWFRRAGVPVDLVAGSWSGIIDRLTNTVLEDWEFITGVGITWGTTTPDILRDFTYSRNLPLWNFVYYNNSAVDYWGDEMMRTLNLTRVKESAIEIQKNLRDEEPYMPIMLWNLFGAVAGRLDPEIPTYDGPGGIRIVNSAGIGLGTSDNRRRSDFDRYHPDTGAHINLWGSGSALDTLNPLEADEAVEWDDVLENVMGGFWGFTPFLREYAYLGVLDEHQIDLWIGPGSSEYVEGNGVYDADFTGTHYDGIPIADVTSANLVGDDVLGMSTTWKLRDDLYWHDSDPGPDGIHGTGDEPSGSVHKVTTADVEYGARICMGKEYPDYENIRYYSTWTFLAGYTDTYDGEFGIEIVDDQTFKVYEERRYVFAFEGHPSILIYTPKHIWEPYIEGPDATKGTEDDGDPAAWLGWEDDYMIDPVRQRLGLSEMHLTHLIGFGPFVFHLGGWDPTGGYTRIEYNPLYFEGKINPGDVDLEFFYNAELPVGNQRYGFVDFADYGRLLDAIAHPSWEGTLPDDPMWDLTADLGWPSQVVSGLVEVGIWYAHLDERWGPGYPLPP